MFTFRCNISMCSLFTLNGQIITNNVATALHNGDLSKSNFQTHFIIISRWRRKCRSIFFYLPHKCTMQCSEKKITDANLYYYFDKQFSVWFSCVRKFLMSKTFMHLKIRDKLGKYHHCCRKIFICSLV